MSLIQTKNGICVLSSWDFSKLIQVSHKQVQKTITEFEPHLLEVTKVQSNDPFQKYFRVGKIGHPVIEIFCEANHIKYLILFLGAHSSRIVKAKKFLVQHADLEDYEFLNALINLWPD